MSIAAFSFTSRVRPVVEIGLGSAQVPTGSALWDNARWDAPSALWSGDEPVWRDITCEVQSVDGELGRARLTDPFPVGTCQLAVDNSSGWADPDVDTPGVLTMRPGRPIRIGVEHVQFGRRWLFRGFVDQILPEYDPENVDLVGLICVDAFGEVGRAKLSATDPTGADETASERVTRILDLVPWLGSKRDIAATSVELVGGVLDGLVADMLRRCADSTGGACFGDGEGNVVFRGRDWLFHTADTPLDGTIGNSSTTAASTGYVTFPPANGSGLHGDTSPPPITAPQMTVAARIRPTSLTPSTTNTIAAHVGAGGIQFTLVPGGQLRFLWWTGPATFAWRYSAPLVGSTMGRDGWLWVGAEYDAAGPIRFFTSPDGETWVPAGVTGTSPSVPVPEVNDLWIGSLGGTAPFAGDIANVVFRDGVDGSMTGGSVVFNFDATADLTSTGATSIVTTSGQTLTVDNPVTLIPSVSTVVPDVCPSGWRRPFARSDIATRVILDRQLPPGDPPSTPRVYNDTPSQILYGVEPFERLDMWTRDDADLDILGQRILAQRSATTMPLVDGVTLDAATGDNVIDLLALVDIWRPSRYRCRLELARGTIFDGNYFATGVAFHMDPDAWTADVSLDWSDLYEIPAASARWDQSRWDRARWTP